MYEVGESQDLGIIFIAEVVVHGGVAGNAVNPFRNSCQNQGFGFASPRKYICPTAWIDSEVTASRDRKSVV